MDEMPFDPNSITQRLASMSAHQTFGHRRAVGHLQRICDIACKLIEHQRDGADLTCDIVRPRRI